ncbi:MAG: toll/interleukin-1 receptor domain-containing protein [Anaerolineae bacterium]
MRLFLSYSRQEFYFADLTATALQAAGHDVWFDVERLSPGLDWKAGIDQGLRDCEALLIIASSAYFASKNCRDEWEGAKGKPVFVLVFEPVAIPDDLQPTAIISGRGGFQHVIKRLRESLESGKMHRDHLARPHFYNRLPGPIALLGMLMLLNALIAALGLLDTVMAFLNSETLTVQLLTGLFLYTVLIVYILSVGYDLVQRRFTRFQLMASFIAPWIVPLPYIANAQANTVNTSLYCIWIPFNIILLLLLLSERPKLALYLWMMRGNAEDGMREDYKLRFGVHQQDDMEAAWKRSPIAAWVKWAQEFSISAAPAPKNGASVKYRILHAPADESIAQQLDHTMRHFGHLPAAEGEQAAQQFLIVSNQTPASLLDKAADSGEVYTVVVASSVNIAEESLRKFQMVDYRGRAQSQLNAIAAYFANPEAGRSAYGLNQLPRPFNWLVTPTSVRIVAAAMRISGAVFIALALNLTLLMLFQPAAVPNPLLPDHNGFTFLLYLLLGLCGVPLIRLSDDLMDRRVPSRTFNILCAGLIAACIVLVVAILTRASPIQLPVESTEQSLDRWVQYAGLVPLIIIGSVIALAQRFRLWLPPKVETLPANEQLVVQGAPYIILGLRDIAVIGIFLALILFGTHW